MLRKIKSIDFQSNNNTSQCVLIRVDFNVPVENDMVADDYRILKSLPTIQYCLDEGAKIVLMSYRGRPKGRPGGPSGRATNFSPADGSRGP